MGITIWPDKRRVPKRQRKFQMHQVPFEQMESRWQCQTCSGVIASDDDIYCISCKMYWQDVDNGLFMEEW